MELVCHGVLDTSSRVVNLGVAVHHARCAGVGPSLYQHCYAPPVDMLPPVRRSSRAFAQRCPDAFILHLFIGGLSLSCFLLPLNAFPFTLVYSQFLISLAVIVNAGTQYDFAKHIQICMSLDLNTR